MAQKIFNKLARKDAEKCRQEKNVDGRESKASPVICRKALRVVLYFDHDRKDNFAQRFAEHIYRRGHQKSEKGWSTS
jgi:hypothetical protein